MRSLAVAAALAVPALAAQAGATLDAIKSKGALRCGVNTGLLGFSAPDSQGKWTGTGMFLLTAKPSSTSAEFAVCTVRQWVPYRTRSRMMLPGSQPWRGFSAG
jgi:ABC-type amino acid transport substrate-binding protein